MTPFTWNTNRATQGNQTVSSIHVGWANYLDTTWKGINTDIQSGNTVSAFPGSVQFPVNAQDEFDVNFNHKFSMKRKIDEDNEYNPDDAFEMAIKILSASNPTGHVDPDNPWQMIYPDAWDSTDILLGVRHGKAARLQKVFRINSMPSGQGQFLEYKFEMTAPDAKLLVGSDFGTRPWTGQAGEFADLENSSAFISKVVGGDTSPWRGAVLHKPTCWYFKPDGTKVTKPVRVRFTIKSNKETALGVKYIRRSDIQEALDNGSPLFTDATFTPDASPETSSVDGRTVASGKSLDWSDMITEAAGFVRDSGQTEEHRVWADGVTDKWDTLERIHILFDTSSIGSGQVVDSADVTVEIDKVYFDDIGLSWNVYASNPASNTALVVADHSTIGTTAFSTARTIVGESTSFTFIEMALNTDGKNAVDMEGISKFGLATQEDRENGVHGNPTWVINDRSGFVVRMAEHATGDPVLTVTHSAASSGMLLQATNSYMRNK